jgi:hypothetical protein
MTKSHRYLASLFLSTALAAPTVIFAAATPQDEHRDDRGVYDRDHKDYHKWDDHENEAWRRFLNENHRKEHEFAKANRKEQSDYWNWRHAHPD